ncbi:MAG: InlB B-repeat-containing protein [Clostridia bacterium]|nr:InlB B-repeat-containing protein [Clostridia bacterium]
MPGATRIEMWGNVVLDPNWIELDCTIELLKDETRIGESVIENFNAGTYAIYEETNGVRQIKFNSKYGGIIKLPYAEISRAGYNFVGWQDVAALWGDYGEIYTTSSGISVSYGTTLVEVWEPIEYTLTLEFEEDAVIDNKTTATTKEITYTIESNDILLKITRPGHIFSYWYLEVPIDGWTKNVYNPGEPLKEKWGDVTLTAVWDMYIYTISFVDGNAAYNETIFYYDAYIEQSDMVDVVYDKDARQLKYGPYSTFKLPYDEMSRDGYEFKGWEVGTDTTGWAGWLAKGSTYGIKNKNIVFAGYEGDVELIEVWGAREYTVTFEYELGTVVDSIYYKDGSTSMSMSYYIEGDLDKIPNATRDGYIFVGWVPKDKVGGWQEDMYSAGEWFDGKWGDVTLEANWLIKGYTITLIQVGSSVISTSYNTKVASMKDVSYSDRIITYTKESQFYLPSVDEITRDGYTFQGWELTTVDGNWPGIYNTPFSGDELIMDLWGDVTLTELWATTSHKLTLKFEADAKIDGKTTLTTKEITYTIESVDTIPYISRDGYDFVGWTVEGMAYGWTEELYDQEESLTGKWGDVTLEANWTPANYEITLLLDGGTIADGYDPNPDNDTIEYLVRGSDHIITYNNTGIFNLPSFVDINKNGYTFGGWEFVTDKSGENNWLDKYSPPFRSDMYGVWGNVTLQAKWTLNSYTLTLQFEKGAELAGFDSENYEDVDGNVKLKQVSIPYTVEDTFNLPLITLGGSTFSYWEIDEKTESWTTSTYGPQAEISGKWGNVTLTAVWDLDLNTIILKKAESGIGESVIDNYNPGSMATYEETSGVRTIKYTTNQFVLPYTEITRNGYTFKGWTIDAETDVTNLPWDANKTYGNEVLEGLYGNVTLIENWLLTEYKITLQFEKDAVIDNKTTSTTKEISYTIEDDTFNLPTITLAGSTFSYWEIDEVTESWTSSTYGPQAPISGKWGDVVLTAKWNSNGYKIILAQSSEVVEGSVSIIDEEYNPAVIEYRAEAREIYYNKDNKFYLPSVDEIRRDGYIFQGWELTTVDENEGNWPGEYDTLFSGDELITGLWGNVTLTEIWSPKQYTLTLKFESDAILTGYDLGITEATINYTIESDGKIPSISCGGRTFVGWTVLGEAYGWTSASYNQEEPFKGKWGNVTLQAQWGNVDYIITLKQVGSSVISTSYNTKVASMKDVSYSDRKITYNKDSVFNLPYDEITRDGYTFEGWKIDARTDVTNLPWDAGIIYKNEELKGLHGNVTLTEIWTPTQYTLRLRFEPDAVLTGYDSGITETTINYTIESDGKIPSISCGGRKFEGWTVLGEAYGWTSASYNQEEPFKGKWGNVTLQACWEDIDYTITLKQVGSSVISTSYNTKVASMKDVSYSDRQITYNKNSQFYLPYQEISREGYTFLGWTIDPETDITNLPWNAERTYKDELLKILYGNVTLVENWIENTYNIELHSNNGSGNSTLVSGIGYTSVVQLTNTSSGRTVEITGSNAKSVSVEWELAYNGYKFVGWAVAGYDSVQSYGYIDVNFSESNINGNGIEGSLEENLQLNWGTKILKDGCNVSQITLGDSVSSQTVHVYAIWLPVYTLTIDANIPTEVLTKDGAVEGVYFNGSKTNKTSIEINNDYFTDYLLYTQLDSDIFYEPSTTGYRLFYYGYYINGWIIKVGHDTYYEISDDYNPSYEEWLIDLSNTKMVNSGVNMRYLQGNIVATPQWKALTFDVRFVTNSSEDYKSGYEDTYISQVTFNANYVIEENVNVTTESMIVQATDILAYSVIYAHPYNSGVLDETIQITRSGAWAYRLQYKKYDQYDAYEANDGWYIVVEGYYSPDLYRLELNIQLPYTTNNDFKVNANGYTLQTTTLDELQNTYASMIPSNLSGKVEYTNSANYTNRQGKMYQADGKYYIYLLQDQIIENEKVYDRYLDGKNITSPTSAVGKQLPTFEIAYYQMQYYYTFNNESNVNMYQIGELDKEHKENAQNKLTKIGARSISEDPDWKYSYCDTNASAGSPNFKLNVYWYRNIVNVEITNLLDSKDTFNGYTLVTENEQVTGSLQEHAKYHLVIYALTDEVYTYTTYAFDDLSILKTTKYEYAKIKQMFDEKSVEELISLGITKINDRVIPIYFGNAFSVEAIDQSKDHTLDEFIGYRFVNYTYSIADKNGSISTCTSLQEYDNYTNDYVNYIVTVDLKEYEHDEQSNTTNYFSDKDILGIDVNFEKIRYTFIYQVTNADYDVVEKYGKIRFDYQEDVIEASQFDYTVTVNDENTLKSRMQVRLGTELLSWDFVNDYITYDLTDPSSQTIRIIMDAQFLRNYLYRANNPNAYESTPEQNVGDVNAVCQDILFNIQVNVQDVKSGEILTTYILNDEEENPVFTLREEVVQVSIDNIYTIVMLSKQTGDEYIYYYNGEDQYAIRKMYIAPSISKSTKLLETEFGYPVKTLSDISMAVSHELLDGSVNYIQYTEVSEDNRYLNFYVEVAPTYKLTFKVEEDVNDQHKGERQVLVENEAVATGIDGEGLELTAISTYLGYWGQETLFRFVGNDTYYKLAQLNIDYIGQDVDRIVEVETNGNVRYAVNEEAEITIKLIPQTYTITTYIEYQGVRYSINDEYGVNGAIPITELVNASGKQIVSEVTVSPIKGNVDPTKPVYYSGDKLLIEYALNTDIESDYEIALYVNNIKIYTDIIEFVDEDIELKIEVKAETESVTIVTNMPTYEVGDIYAQINNREMIEVNPSSGTELGLINGDQVTIYIKEAVGFEFVGRYEYHKKMTDVTQTEGEGEYEGYTKFTMFSGGFELKDNGWYYIQFKQIPIEIEFEYYEEIPDIKPVAAGYGYMATSNTSIIQKGSEITINKGVDAQGYRYQRYTYAGPGDQGINLELTNNSGEDKFIITEEIMQYLSTQEELVLTIYINYVHQYRYQIEYECKPTEVTWNVVDMQGNRLEENDYYDYDTRMNILVESKDSEHYKIEATIITQDENEVIKEGCRPHDIKSEKETNKGHLSGFEVVRDLRSDCTIVIGIDAEEYDTKLYEKLYNGEDDTVENATSLKLQGESQFELTNKIYYEVESSHKYGSEVVVRIYVVNVPEMYDGEQYYKLSKVNLNGRELEVTELDTEGETESVYEIKYILEGSSLPIEQSLEVYFTALYLVRISMRGNS